MYNLNSQFSFKQSGAVLIISMLILLVMTIIGVTAMQTTTLEERMAGNMRDQNVAFQTAEVALRAGEEEIEALFSVGAFTTDCSDYKHVAEADLDSACLDEFDATTWSGNKSKIYAGASLGSGLKTPRYFIQIMTDINSGGPDPLDQCGYGEDCKGTTITAFRIVAHGTGTSGTSSVLLESRYGKLF